MTPEEILKWLSDGISPGVSLYRSELRALVEYVRASERERCARIVEHCPGLVWEVAALIRKGA